MSRRDLIHDSVRKALENDGWIVTDDPLEVRMDDGLHTAAIDLGAYRVITAEKANERIAVEVKSFISPSLMTNFHSSMGQYLGYRDALEETGSDRVLYLAISEGVYNRMVQIDYIQRRIQKYGILIIVVDVEEQIISQWA